MKKADILHGLIKDNAGYLKICDAVDAGISRTYVRDYVKNNNLHRACDGMYLAPEAQVDGMYVIQVRYPQAIFSHESALYLQALIKRQLPRYTITLKAGSSTSRLRREGIKVYKVKQERFEIGLCKTKSPQGHCLRAYNAERTICDIIRSRRTIEAQAFQMALKKYVHKRDKDIPRLMEYAGLFSLDKTVMKYLEVLL